MIMETKFTKGEWILNKDRCEIVSENDWRINGGIDIIAQCYTGFNLDGTSEECLANAKLIAAAPEMFEELDNLITALERFYKDPHQEELPVLGDAKRILKKATESWNDQ